MLRTLAVSSILAGGLAFAAAPAHAASLPDCAASTHCTNNSQGEAGYYGAEDLHTNYRFVETTVTANAHLVNLNGSGATATACTFTGTGCDAGAVGVELCSPDTSAAQQLGLWWDPADGVNGGFVVSYASGTLTAGPVADPCVGSTLPLVIPVNTASQLVGPQAPTTVSINLNDQVYLGEYYTPSGRHMHQVSYGVCDVTQGWCRQAYSSSTEQHFSEFGIGALSELPTLTGGAVNPLETFTASNVTCYSCKSSVPLSDISGIGGLGGLYEAQWINASSQVEMSANDSLSGSTFSLSEGSTSS
jgi:hypothetical protein